ncbi:hypothetical protein [Bradyrhizobium frederickii]|nr:hypothetical protein [Bradyrhizobium frederickii]
MPAKGKKSRGPFTGPRSQQGYPVIIQASASDHGQRLAVRWARVAEVP